MDVNKFIASAEKFEKKQLEVTEKDVEDAFVQYAKNNGCRALKLRFLSGRGFPDRTVLCPGGRMFFIEFKRPGKSIVLKNIQAMIRDDELVPYGFEYYVCNDEEKSKQILDDFLWAGL